MTSISFMHTSNREQRVFFGDLWQIRSRCSLRSVLLIASRQHTAHGTRLSGRKTGPKNRRKIRDRTDLMCSTRCRRRPGVKQRRHASTRIPGSLSDRLVSTRHAGLYSTRLSRRAFTWDASLSAPVCSQPIKHAPSSLHSPWCTLRKTREQPFSRLTRRLHGSSLRLSMRSTIPRPACGPPSPPWTWPACAAKGTLT